MEILCRLVFAICIFTIFKAGLAQLITEPTGKESNCFGQILEGNCSETNTRAFVKQVNAGAKFNERNIGNDSCVSSSAPSLCCVHEVNDCYGEYNAVDTDPYSYHKDCTGKYKCSQRQATRMDTAYFNCNTTIYPAHTTYMDVEFYCIDVNNITPLNNGNKQNNGQGSTLYLWSGDSSSYSELTVATHTCSVETDCDGEISVLSLDFRFAPDNVNITCIEDNMLSITDESNTNHFNCSSNNNFDIRTLYTSHSNYIAVTYTGTNAGGYLWLGFQTSSNGNLTINCQSPGQIQTCETSTTEEPTTTEQETTTQQSTTPESTTSLQSTTNETTTGSLASTEDQTFTTDNSSTTTDKVENGKSESPSSGNNTGMIAGIVAALFLIIIIIVIAVVVYRRIIIPWRAKKKQASTQEHPGELPHTSEPHTNEQDEGLHARTSNGNNTNVENTRKILRTTKNSLPAIEINTVSKETKTGNPNVITNNEHENNVEKNIDSNTMVGNDQFLSDFNPGTSQPQFPPPTNLIQDPSVEKRKKKKKKKKHMKNKVEDVDNELLTNGCTALQETEADIETINENGEHSRKQKKKKKRTKTHEIASELNGQEILEESHERKEKKKKKKKRKEIQSEDFIQEEENTTIITQTIEEEHATE